MAWLVRKRFETNGYIKAFELDIRYLAQRRKSAAVFTGVTVFSLALILFFFPSYWEIKSPPMISTLQTGLTEDGHPWIGNDTAPIVIHEFSDYHCFQCKKMNYYLRQLIARYPDSLKLIHHHFPMDSRFNPILRAPFHEGAGTMSLIAIHATENGIFWPVNDYLFNIAGNQKRINLNQLAAKFGLDAGKTRNSLEDAQTRQKLLRDIKHGLQLGLTGTPSYVVNGKVYHGMIPDEILQKVQN
jgi:protein-disulfide isomerase